MCGSLDRSRLESDTQLLVFPLRIHYIRLQRLNQQDSEQQSKTARTLWCSLNFDPCGSRVPLSFAFVSKMSNQQYADAMCQEISTMKAWNCKTTTNFASSADERGTFCLLFRHTASPDLIFVKKLQLIKQSTSKWKLRLGARACLTSIFSCIFVRAVSRMFLHARQLQVHDFAFWTSRMSYSQNITQKAILDTANSINYGYITFDFALFLRVVGGFRSACESVTFLLHFWLTLISFKPTTSQPKSIICPEIGTVRGAGFFSTWR